MNILSNDTKRESHCVNMVDCFYFEEQGFNFIALVFEKLGKSLYDFIKFNKYRGRKLN